MIDSPPLLVILLKCCHHSCGGGRDTILEGWRGEPGPVYRGTEVIQIRKLQCR
jgi:hypothetical protein